MGDMERYRAKIERRYRNRRTPNRYVEGGRRVADFKSPPFWTLGFVVQFLTLIVGGAVLLFFTGCVYVKRTFLGG